MFLFSSYLIKEIGRTKRQIQNLIEQSTEMIIYWNNYLFAELTKTKLKQYLDDLFKFKFPRSK